LDDLISGENPVYTRCPHCQTTFRLTAAQLKARDGQVRCGRCQQVFQADRHLVERPARSGAKPGSTARKRTTRRTKPPTPAPAENQAPSATESAAAVTAPLPPRPKPARTRRHYWTIGSALLVLLLIGQGVMFYGRELARTLPLLRDPILATCAVLPCRHLGAIDLRRLDLVETQVTPHPRYDRALRVRATIVNRAEYAQPYPLLEVSLIDSQGHLVARRAYPPHEYLKNADTIRSGLSPHVAVNVALDITGPGPKASGYEVLLLPPTE
jgi:predicted Zn finger-like uncharacterized protein